MPTGFDLLVFYSIFAHSSIAPNIFCFSRQLAALERFCPVAIDEAGDSVGCVSSDLKKCRAAIISARGSHLEEPCNCESGDDRSDVERDECVRWLYFLLPTNPCLGSSNF